MAAGICPSVCRQTKERHTMPDEWTSTGHKSAATSGIACNPHFFGIAKANHCPSD